MPTLKPLRNNSEYKSFPYFAYSGSDAPNKGTVVKGVGTGFLGQDLALGGSVGASYANVVSERWVVVPQVAKLTDTGSYPLGILLYDANREYDENGIPLKYDPEKAAQMQVTISGQNVIVVTEGEFMYSGISGNPVFGAPLWPDTNGALTAVANPGGNFPQVGKALSQKDVNGWTFVSLKF